MKNLELEIKKVIIDSLNLEGMAPEDIDPSLIVIFVPKPGQI